MLLKSPYSAPKGILSDYMNKVQREAKRKAIAALRPLVKRNPNLELKEAAWELNYISRIHVSDRTVSRYLAAIKKELAADKPKPKSKTVSPKKAEKAHGISCPICENFLHFDRNPTALIGCLGGGNGKDNHLLLHYDRSTAKWTYAHDNSPYGKKKADVVGYV